MLKIIFFIILFYYLAKFLTRMFAPVIIQKAADSIHENMRQQYGRQYSQQNQDACGQSGRGEAERNAAKPKYPRETKKVGEYVDFEEIE